MDLITERSEIVFFDLETTMPSRSGDRVLLEFGAVLVCPQTLAELHTYSTLVKPSNPNSIISDRSNGITKEALASAPSFGDVADTIYDILHGRVWAGHNIVRFDWPRIREAFEEIGHPAPEPKGTIDSLVLLTQKFGNRAGNMKMATLANYFKLGDQTHRSLEDARMNIEVLKYCATVLFLETSSPDILVPNYWISPDEVSESSVSASRSIFYRGIQKIQLLHNEVLLQLCSSNLRVKFGVNRKSGFLDHAGRPRLNIIVYPSACLCDVLDVCDDLAEGLFVESGSNSEWKPVVIRSNDISSTTIRLHIPIVTNGDSATYSTEIYLRDANNNLQRLDFRRYDGTELVSLFTRGTLVDAFFSLDVYDYQQFAGIRLVAQKLIIHSS